MPQTFNFAIFCTKFKKDVLIYSSKIVIIHNNTMKMNKHKIPVDLVGIGPKF